MSEVLKGVHHRILKVDQPVITEPSPTNRWGVRPLPYPRLFTDAKTVVRPVGQAGEQWVRMFHESQWCSIAFVWRDEDGEKSAAGRMYMRAFDWELEGDITCYWIVEGELEVINL